MDRSGPPAGPPGAGKPGREGRQHERYDVDWRVSLKCASWAMASRVAASNASRGGIFLLTTKPPPIGTAVSLSIQLPDGETLEVQGTVVHVVTPEQAAGSDKPAGVGVRIGSEHAADLARMEQHATAAEAPAAPPKPTPGELEARDASSPTILPSSTPPKQPAPRPTGAVAPALGIDFGTTFTSASVAIGDRVHLVVDAEGRTLTPSVVHYPERGAPIVGWQAREKLISDPRRTIASVKRLVGRHFSDPSLAGYLASLAVRTAAGPGDTVLLEMDDREKYAAVQVAAAIIAHARDLAEAQTGTTFKKVAMSHPVTFIESERAALRRAAQLAGLEVVAFVEEPVAGAMAYGLGRQKNEIVAVYDFGGGTFDFTVLDVSNDRFRVLASEGDSWLGGDDFDLTIAQAVADAFWRATKIELRQRLVEWQRLLYACERAKRELTEAPVTRIVVDGLVETPKRIDLKQKLDRAIFERLCKPLFDRSVTVMEAALGRAGLDPGDVTQLVVTGGVSAIPFVREGLARMFERDVTAVVNPQEAICLGAGMSAAQAVQHEVKGVAG